MDPSNSAEHDQGHDAVDSASASTSAQHGHVGVVRERAIGPAPITSGNVKKRSYKFVEPPGISEWVISFVKKCLVCGLVYSFGYFQISVGWLVGPIVLLVARDQWRRHHDAQRNLAMASARGDEREIVLARLGDNLPSWVIFPDVERAEWMNQIIKQLWPRINHFTYDLIVNTIEPGLRETLATSYKLGSFKFEKIILGDQPVRIRGVKVYDEKRTDRNEIIMDLDVVYGGDCDFRFSVARIKAGLKDLQLSGTLRLVLKPLINQIPLIGGVQYFFLNPPALDFNLIGIADVFDMPGLSDLLRRVVQEQISNMVVLPNKMFIQLSDAVNARETCATQPEGVIRICAVEARNLLKKDVGVLGTGKSDPYIVLSVGAQQHKSKVINNTVNPKWEFYCETLVCSIEQRALIEVWDFDPGFPGVLNDDFLGRASVDLGLVRREGTVDMWLDLEGVRKGQVHLRLTWLSFTDNIAELKNAVEESHFPGLSSALLTVKVDSVKNLPTVRENSKPDPYVVLSVGKTQQESITLEKTLDPVYEETFHFLVRNPNTDTLLLKMVDRKSNHELGSMKQALDFIMGRPHLTLEKQNFNLSVKHDSKVALEMKIKILKAGKVEDVSENSEIEDEGIVHDTSHDSQSHNSQPGASNRSPHLERTQSTTSAPGPTKPLLDNQSVSSSNDGDSQHHGSVRKRVSGHMSTSAPISSSPGQGSDNGMKVRLTIRYSESTQMLVVVVHSVANLPIEKEELPDPYVKLYVLPEKGKKHKTEAQKDQTNPLYDERFDFPMVDVRGKTLHVQVCDKKFMRSSPKMGEVYVALEEFQQGNALTNWYPLSP